MIYSYSTDGGATWSGAKKITPAGSAQWQPWSGVTQDGSTLWVAYYDRSYNNCEFTGCNDITLANVNNPWSNVPTIGHRRITTSSMPNLIPANNPLEAGFLGDYMWLAVDARGRPKIVWADMRGRIAARGWGLTPPPHGFYLRATIKRWAMYREWYTKRSPGS